ncbi:MAG: hypothetical protein ACI9VR_005454 [Cognaticolwellia sp.]|jgi:hypothetical protein
MSDPFRFLGQLRHRIRSRLDAMDHERLDLTRRGEHLRALPGVHRRIATLRVWQLQVQTLLLARTRDGLEAPDLEPADLEQARDVLDLALDAAIPLVERQLARRIEDRQPGHRLMRQRLLGDAATLLSELCERLPVEGLPQAPPRSILSEATWERSWTRLLGVEGTPIVDVDLERLAQHCAALGGRIRVLHPTEHALSCALALSDLPNHANDPIWRQTLAGCTLVGERWWLRLNDGSRAQHTQWGLDPTLVLPEEELETEK